MRDDVERQSICQNVQYIIWSEIGGVLNFIVVILRTGPMKAYYSQNNDSPVLQHTRFCQSGVINMSKRSVLYQEYD